MQITFYKYQGTGNDFIIIDNRNQDFPKSVAKLIAQLCDRRFGIGADGVLLLENDSDTDFRMVYYNADGNEGSMCGNGGRCLVAFARSLKIISNETSFIAIDGLHQAQIFEDGLIALQMKDVDTIEITAEYIFLDTGSPHHVQIDENLATIDVKILGSNIRNSDMYGKVGTNVNFVKQENEDTFSMRTYERGVEDETYSCGTGASAVAIAMRAIGKTTHNKINLNVKGGKLEVSFNKNNEKFTDVFLKGPAEFIFKGEISISMEYSNTRTLE